MTKTQAILQALSELGFRPAKSSSRKYQAFTRPEWLVQEMIDRGNGRAAANFISVGKSAAFRSGATVTTSHSLDAGTAIKRWQATFAKENPDQELTSWKF